MKTLFILFLALKAYALPTEQIQKYEQRYQLNSKNQKLVDNLGEGYENLYGVRNFRAVLRGIIYRGGANNAFNKYGKRENQNPLPDMGLKNLCKKGFKSAVYLYSTNFSSAAKQTNCQAEEKNNTLSYVQISGLDEKNQNLFLEMVYKAIKGQIPSPIYMHCWNGWHASGLVSTLTLRQFCGLSPKEGLAYWIQNTDENSKGYDSIKNRILSFKPLSEFQISEQERREICITD